MTEGAIFITVILLLVSAACLFIEKQEKRKIFTEKDFPNFNQENRKKDD